MDTLNVRIKRHNGSKWLTLHPETKSTLVNRPGGGSVEEGLLKVSENVEEQLGGFTAQLAQKITKGQASVSDINKNLGKFDQTYMTDTFLQQMAGTTPINAIPADGSLTSEKYANASILPSKLSQELQNNLIFLENTINGAGTNRDGWSFSTVGGVGNLQVELGYFRVDTSSSITVYHPITFEAGDVLYISTNHYADGLAPSSFLDFLPANNTVFVDSNRFSLSGSQTASKNSSLLLYPKAAGNRIYLNRRGVGSKFWFNSLVVINLTQSFGKGNEPDKRIVDDFVNGYANNYIEGQELFNLTHYLLSANSDFNLRNDITGTVQNVSRNANNEINKIEHKKTDDNTIVREDIFTYGVGILTEKRTLATGETITFIYNLETYTVEVI